MVRQCPRCDASIKMVSYEEMNFRKDMEKNRDQMYWCCVHYPDCDTYISADSKTKEPSGILAGPSLRHKRIVIHHWETLLQEGGIMDKTTFRSMCAYQIGVEKQGMVHTRNMNETKCDSIIAYLQTCYENDVNIHNLVESRPNGSVWKQVRGYNTAPNHGVVYSVDDGAIAD